MKKFFFMLISLLWGLFIWNLVLADRFEDELERSIQEEEETFMRISGNYEVTDFRDFIIYVWTDILFPIVVIIGVIIATIWFYKLMFKSEEDEIKKWTNYLIWGTVGVIIMSSATFIGNTLVGSEWTELADFDWIEAAELLYEEIFYPFFVLALYLIVWILFIILLIHSFKFVATQDEEITKHSKNIIIWNIIGIIAIVFSHEIVSLIYWSDVSTASQVGDIGGWILEEDNVDFVATVINWVFSILALLLVAIIIYQAYLLLVKPDDEETTKKLKRNFLYVLVGILIIWWGYLLANFLVID